LKGLLGAGDGGGGNQWRILNLPALYL